MNKLAIGKKGRYIIIILILAIIISNIITYLIVKNELGNTANQLAATFTQALDYEHRFSEEQRGLILESALENFKNLESYINKETNTLKLNLETQLSDVGTKVGDLEKKSSELEEKISNINVKSSDFSSIVEDVVKTVVNVQTNLGQGSGVIFDKRGYVLTNKHVIENAKTIKVIDYDSNVYNVRLIGIGQSVDLAVLKIDSSYDNFDFLRFEDISNVGVGERVIAVGNPLGLSFTVTEGIVSSTNRIIEGQSYLQSDVPINAGNSGGPLINTNKRIVGINTFKLSSTEGLGFAIPSDVCQEITDQALAQDQNLI